MLSRRRESRPGWGRLLVLALLAVAIGGCGPSQPESAPDRPNVVLVITDDQGYGDFGVTGNPVIETPNLDTLARRSAEMQTFYVSPVCAPTRAALMTGRYNQRTGVTDTWMGRALMRTEEVTLAEALREAGYTTGLFGKWHLGDNYPMRPMDQGFDRALWHKGGGLAQPSEPPANNGRYTNPILFEGEETFKADGYVTDVLFDHALSFIEEHQDRPFFAYISTNAPHAPYDDVPDSLEAYYRDRTDALRRILTDPPEAPEARRRQVQSLAAIAAMITNIDQNVGRLMERLHALDLTRETLVVFLTDNGPGGPARYVGPFRGGKSGVYEGGVRVPLWLHWPGTLSPEREPAVPAAHIDLMPTILEAVGAAPPEDRSLDGRSFWGLLTGADTSWTRRDLVVQSHRGPPEPFHNFLVRRGPWKLVRSSGPGWSLPANPPSFELYNVREDPGERRNRADERPGLVADLKKAYQNWYEDVGGPRLHQQDPPVRIRVGTPHENPSVLTRQDWRGGRTWSTDLPGYWELDAEPGTYDVTLRLPDRTGARRLVLSVGGVERTANIPPDVETHTFEGLSLDGGAVRFHPILGPGGDPDGVERAILDRTDL